MSDSETRSRNASPMWRRYLRLLRPDVRADVTDELEFHIEMIAARYIASGMSPDEARTKARVEFGDLERARRECETIGAERERRHEWSELISSTWQDARLALRSLGRSPGLAAAIVLTLALGVGASTAIFSIVRGVLLRPLPFVQPNELVRLWEVFAPRGDDHNVVSAGNYASWRRQAKSFSVIGAHRAPYGVSLVGDGEPIRIRVVDITPSAMQALGARAALGRSLTPDDDRGDGRIILLSDGLWQRRFGADAGVIGRQMTVNDVRYTIVGVMPAEFEFPSAGVDIWRPVTDTAIDLTERRSHNWYVIGRLAPNATLPSARAEMRTIAGALQREFPEFMTNWGTNVVAMQDDLVAPVRPVLLVLMTGSVLLLLVACANIANLLLARAVGRRREIAVRSALGAGRGRLVRQLLTESTVIALFGGALGIAVAGLLTRGLLTVAPTDIPRLSAVHIDGTVLSYALAVTLASGLLFGLAPAFRLAKSGRRGAQSLQSILRASDARAGGGGQGRARSLLLVGELAVSLVLLTGAGLLLRSAYRLSQIEYGYQPDGLVTAALDLPRARYPDSVRQVEFYDRLMERISRLPHVTSVAGTIEELGTANSMTFSFAIEGRPSRNASGREDAQPLRVVAGDYFRTAGIPLKRGRAFSTSDRASSPPVVIVNESLARLLWPDRDPVGTRLSFVGAAGPWLEIVGVVGDTRSNSADAAPAPAMDMPFSQKRWSWMSWMTLIVRTDGTNNLEALGASLRDAVWQLDGQLPIQRIATVRELYRESLARRRFATVLTGAFAAAALLLGTIGMYGVLSYGVVQRRREFGIRIALGASSSKVTRVVVSEALLLAVVAVAIGTGAALAVTRLLSALLYEVSPTDPVTFVVVATLVTLVAGAAAWIPARRATRIDPAITIRET
jgi:putative ABC transport system permease protein